MSQDSIIDLEKWLANRKHQPVTLDCSACGEKFTQPIRNHWICPKCMAFRYDGKFQYFPDSPKVVWPK